MFSRMDTSDTWHHIHEQLTSLSKKKAQLAAEEAHWLLEAERARVHERLGYGSFTAYVGAVLGYSEREARERLMVAERLEELPKTAEALSKGKLVWSGARELSRVATSETEQAWLDEARDMNVRQIEKLVSGHELGDLPDDPKEHAAKRHVLRFEVDGATYATWREAVKKVRAETGGSLSEEQALLAIARIVLEGPNDEGRANYQIAVTVCGECGEATQDGRGEPITISEAARDMAMCDAQFIGDPTHVGDGKRATQSIPPAKRRAVLRRDHGQCVVDGCSASTFVDVHHLTWREDGGSHDTEQMALACSGHHAAAHAGTLYIEGSPSTGLSFFHADGSPYGSPHVDTRAAQRNTERFIALKARGRTAEEAWKEVLPP
jgi:hypothetical protein